MLSKRQKLSQNYVKFRKLTFPVIAVLEVEHFLGQVGKIGFDLSRVEVNGRDFGTGCRYQSLKGDEKNH